MRLNPVVAKILSAPNFDRFLALELRSAYLAVVDDKTCDPCLARRLIYNELVKLVNQGWLRKTISKKKENTTFIKTDSFDATQFETSYRDKAQGKNELSKLPEELFIRLNQCKRELLSGLGEADEYKRICDQYPCLQEELQPRYNKVRDSNSRLLGSIKAIESIFKQNGVVT